ARIAATGNALRGNASQQEKPTPVRFGPVHRSLKVFYALILAALLTPLVRIMSGA
ncbi:MAG: hypothetical protein PPHEMADE_0421, partial [uncultured Paraburkholderia sp.]